MTMSNYREKQTLEAIKTSGKWVKLHVGDPGENGTENAAKEVKRKEVTWSAPEELGYMTNSGDIEWAAVETEGEDDEFSHVSIWSAESGGNCEGSGALAEKIKVKNAQDFRIKATKLKYELN